MQSLFTLPCTQRVVTSPCTNNHQSHTPHSSLLGASLGGCELPCLCHTTPPPQTLDNLTHRCRIGAELPCQHRQVTRSVRLFGKQCFHDPRQRRFAAALAL